MKRRSAPRGEYTIGDWADLAAREPTESFDAIVTDPPYGRLTSNRWDRAPDWETLAHACRRLLRGKAPPFVVFGRQPQMSVLGRGFEAAGWELRDEALWVKGNTAIWHGGKKFRHAHENIWWFLPHGAPQEAIFFDAASISPARAQRAVYRKRPLSETQRFSKQPGVVIAHKTIPPLSILSYPPLVRWARVRVGHPTEKPGGLMELLIRLFVPIGGRILDPFAGSGSTIRGALAAGRFAKGYDSDPRWEAALRAACRTTRIERPGRNTGGC